MKHFKYLLFLLTFIFSSCGKDVVPVEMMNSWVGQKKEALIKAYKSDLKEGPADTFVLENDVAVESGSYGESKDKMGVKYKTPGASPFKMKMVRKFIVKDGVVIWWSISYERVD